MSTVVAGGELRIRPATNDDAEKISHVILQALRETNARDYPPHIIERLEQSFGTGTVLRMIADQTVFVAEADGNIVGTAGFDGKAVRSVFVAPQSQGLGVGRSLVHEVEYAARACQLETLRLNSSVTAESFYKKLGYAVVEEKLYGDERTIVMERHLSPRVGDYCRYVSRTSTLAPLTISPHIDRKRFINLSGCLIGSGQLVGVAISAYAAMVVQVASSRGPCNMSRIPGFSSPFLLGFDEIERVLDRVSKAANDGYPPYNIERLQRVGRLGDVLRITLAVAGFTREQLEVTIEESQLVIRGRQIDDDKTRQFLHRGIAARQFQRMFVLAEGIEVIGAELKDGLLSVDLARPEPERIIRRIDIAIGD